MIGIGLAVTQPGSTTGLAATAKPTNTTAPTVSGVAAQGQTLVTSTGAWDQPVTGYAYKWQRSSDGSTGWADISGATAQTYTPVSGDVGKFLRSGVLASNSFGSAVAGYAFSAATGAIASGAPANTALPTISGIQTVGQTLSVATGTWTNSPTSKTYQWRKAGTNIAGATATTYVIQASDAGAAIDCVETATNTYGSTSATAASVTPAAALTISGTPGAATVDAGYSFTPTLAGGHPPYACAVDSAPAWTTFVTATGTLTGTPGSGDVGTDTGITITVTDADGLTAVLGPFSITVAEASEGITPPTLIASQAGTSPTATATADAAGGALIALIMKDAGGFSTFSDSTGATWTEVYAFADAGYSQLGIWKRMVGANPIVGGTTSFTVAGYFGSGGSIDVYHLPDATGIPTTLDATGQMLPDGSGFADPDPTGTGDLGTGSGVTAHMPAPTANSYQFAIYTTYNVAAGLPGFGSDASWQGLATHSSIGDNHNGVAIAYRKGPSTATALVCEAGGFTFNYLLWAEVAAAAGNDTGAGTGGGSGGDGGTVSNAAELAAVMNAGRAASGNQTWTLAPGDYGSFSFYNYNYATAPITLQGQEGVTFSDILVHNSHGITLKDAVVTGLGVSTGSGIMVEGGSTDIIFDGVRIDRAGYVDGDRADGRAFFASNGRTQVNANIQFIGRGDNSLVDVRGYGLGLCTIGSDGVLFKNATLTGISVDGIDIFGSSNVTVDYCFGYNFYSDVAGGDHPDFCQWAHYDGYDEGANVLIKNSGFQVGSGAEPQGFFGDTVNGITVQDCWVFGGIYNTFAASACQNVLFSDCFGQGNSVYGSRCIVRGGSDTITVTKVHVAAIANYTEPADPDHGFPDPLPNTNYTDAGDNVLIGNRENGDYTDLDPWLATHPDTRPRLAI